MPPPPEPFSEARDPAVISGLFWARLLTYRPLFLLGGLWLVLVCVSAIAYHGLMFNEPVKDMPVREAPITVATPQSLASASEVEPIEVEPLEAEPQFSGVMAWGLISLLGLCGFGCFVLTQQIKASARPKRKKVRPRPVAQAPTPARPPHPKRLAPYSPQRDGVVVPGFRIVETPSELPPAAPTAPPPKPRPIPQAQRRSVSRPQPVNPPPKPATAVQPYAPAVVPEGTDLALDWSEGSVAHALDVRQRRSLSSFM
ncbi:hypothetical protein [Nodosilinea sp. E11]|uniref:hypothetical protein n=1 Tax=Nodosilinea sp. E11 TaxID=3037479 RepID=UPI0029344C2A|nr:hypothetical protein [Nodosilinea sp. E11]WOD37784.1 hypothetical protein RRF56_16355 [Nodosilinea sp. E11]